MCPFTFHQLMFTVNSVIRYFFTTTTSPHYNLTFLLIVNLHEICRNKLQLNSSNNRMGGCPGQMKGSYHALLIATRYIFLLYLSFQMSLSKDRNMSTFVISESIELPIGKLNERYMFFPSVPRKQKYFYYSL